MGLLDDAIREHLDLKRRHGADPAEVARAEREALGPVRRAPERTDDDELPAAEPAEHEDLIAPEVPYDDEPIDFEGDEPSFPLAREDEEPLADEPEDRFQDGSRRAYDQTADLAPRADIAPRATEPEPDSWSYDAGADDPEPAAPAPHRADPPAADPQRHGYADHTAEYDVEEALGSEPAWSEEPAAENPAQDGEDVLEETPEFLQDTPDHDRLWFEQRPPRDFDFDK